MATINGFSVEPYGSAKIKTYIVPRTVVKLNLRAEVAPLLLGLASDFNLWVETLYAKECGGHAYRKIAGSSSWSFHALGVALDLNWDHHPMGVRATFTSRQIMLIRDITHKWSYGGKPLFRWGGDYQTRPDDMHFELIQSRANCLAAVKLLQTPPYVPNWTDTIVNAFPTLRKGATGFHVRLWQGILCAHGFTTKIDGDFGGDTVEKTKALQRKYGADKGIDGVVGRETWSIGTTARDIV